MVISLISFSKFSAALGGMVYRFQLFTGEACFGLD
jgi:hypothetical protein